MKLIGEVFTVCLLCGVMMLRCRCFIWDMSSLIWQAIGCIEWILPMTIYALCKRDVEIILQWNICFLNVTKKDMFGQSFKNGGSTLQAMRLIWTTSQLVLVSILKILMLLNLSVIIITKRMIYIKFISKIQVPSMIYMQGSLYQIGDSVKMAKNVKPWWIWLILSLSISYFM